MGMFAIINMIHHSTSFLNTYQQRCVNIDILLITEYCFFIQNISLIWINKINKYNHGEEITLISEVDITILAMNKYPDVMLIFL